MKKKFLSVLCGALLFGMLAGCGGNATNDVTKGDDANSANEVTQSGPIKLRVWAEEDNFTMLEK